MAINKSLVTNGLAVLLTIVGYFSPVWREPLFNTGIFALSGAFTNWIAIYMLFERIPYLYGSGVIPARFEEFKDGIKRLIMQQFFTSANLDRFLREQSGAGEGQAGAIDLSSLIDGINYDELFGKLLQAAAESPLGPMLALMGGDKALLPMKDTFIRKMKSALLEMTVTAPFQRSLQAALSHIFDSELMVAKVEAIVQKRLDELTPKMVKNIIEDMIHAHLGWLVVWGGVFGGLIGLIASVIP